MMKKWFIVPTLFLLASCCPNQESINRSRILYQDRVIEDIKIGDKILIEPKTLVYEGESKTVEGQIILPDGTSKSGKSFIIEMPGIYTVNYRAFFGTHEESVSLIYHCHRKSGDFFVSSNKNNPADTGEYSHPVAEGSIKGAILHLDSKTVYTYDGEIDFNSFDFNNSFIDFIVDTSKQNTSDIETFTVRLTDTEDSNNYVDITITDSGPVDNEGKGCYLLAGSNSQFKTGFEGGPNGIKWTSKYGANVAMSFRDLPDKGANVASLYFDYVNKALYAFPMIGMWGDARKNIITDLDDKEIYGSAVWEGFKSGKATLSIFANSLYSNSATLLVSKIANHDLSPLDFVDTDSPVIKIDYNGQSSINIPMASINKPYRIYDAIISDNYDNRLSYSTYVTYYDSEKGVNKDVSVVDGYFIPTKEGKYTITYIAKDHSNNYANRTIDITAIDDEQKMTIHLDSDTINQDLYTKINLPSVNEVRDSITGGSGKPTVKRTIFDSDNNPVEIKEDYFIPNKIGQYKVYYTATDYIENVTTALLTVNVTDPGHPVFIEEFSLPRILIKGHKYTLPKYVGAEVIDNKTVYLDSKVYVNDELLEDNTFTAKDECEIKYQLNGQSGVKNFIQSVDIIDCGNPIELTNYFYGNFAKELNEDSVTLSASSGEANALFASVLPSNKQYLKFAIDREAFKCDEVVFKFSDSVNANNSLSFHIKVKNNKTYISIASDTTEYEFASFVEGDYETYVIDFSATSRILKDVLHKEVEIIKYNDQGDLFCGFSGGTYLDIFMNNVKQETELNMLTISNQPLGHLNMSPYSDFADPIVVFNKTFINEQEYGKNAYVPSVQVFDVLSNAKVTVSVTTPDGSYKINNQDGTVDHTFVLDQFGSYIVTYRGTDAEGNSYKYPRKITVYDFVAPEITITGSLSSTYSLNSSITIPTYKVTDNLNDYTLDVLLIMPDNQERLLLIDKNGIVTSYLDKNNMYYNSSFKVDSRTFRAEQYGHYTLRFVAYDSDFNKTVKDLYFEVK